MKRSILLLLVLIMMVPTTVMAAQDVAQLTASAIYDKSNSVVRVSGNLSTGEGQWVTIQLMHADKNPIYFDQIYTEEGGSFVKEIPIPKPRKGKYEVWLGAIGLEQVTKASFVVEDQIPSPGEPEETDASESEVESGTGKENEGAEDSQVLDNKIILNGKINKEIDAEGNTVALIQLEKKQWANLQMDDTKSNVTVVVNSDSSERIQEFQISLDDLQSLKKNQVDKIVFQNNQAVYELPWLDVISATSKMGSGAKVVLRMSQLSEQVEEKILTHLGGSSSQRVASPMEFTLSVGTGTTLQRLDHLSGYYPKSIPLGQGMDPKKIVGIFYNPKTDIIYPVPTVVEYHNGKWVGILKHRNNGIYMVVQNDHRFIDTQGHWSQSDVELLANRLIINGVSESRFDPDGEVTRAQFAAILVRALGLDKREQVAHFLDINDSDWYEEAIQMAVQAGIVAGYTDGSFRPDQPISRQELTVMLQRAAKFVGISPLARPSAYQQVTGKFDDSDLTFQWAQDAMSEAIQRGWIVGRTNTQLAPQGTASRAEAAVMIKRLLLDLEFINE